MRKISNKINKVTETLKELGLQKEAAEISKIFSKQKMLSKKFAADERAIRVIMKSFFTPNEGELKHKYGNLVSLLQGYYSKPALFTNYIEHAINSLAEFTGERFKTLNEEMGRPDVIANRVAVEQAKTVKKFLEDFTLNVEAMTKSRDENSAAKLIAERMREHILRSMIGNFSTSDEDTFWIKEFEELSEMVPTFDEKPREVVIRKPHDPSNTAVVSRIKPEDIKSVTEGLRRQKPDFIDNVPRKNVSPNTGSNREE
jgi:hypothetical protein